VKRGAAPAVPCVYVRAEVQEDTYLTLPMAGSRMQGCLAVGVRGADIRALFDEPARKFIGTADVRQRRPLAVAAAGIKLTAVENRLQPGQIPFFQELFEVLRK